MWAQGDAYNSVAALRRRTGLGGSQGGDLSLGSAETNASFQCEGAGQARAEPLVERHWRDIGGLQNEKARA